MAEVQKKFEKRFEKRFAKKVRKYYKLSEGREGRGGEGGWVRWGKIVILMSEALPAADKNFSMVLGHRFGTPILHTNWDTDSGCRFGIPIWDTNFELFLNFFLNFSMVQTQQEACDQLK
jgi:hypothetical protein